MDDPRQHGPNGAEDPPRAAAQEAQRMLRDAFGAAARAASGEGPRHGGEYQCVGPCPICRTADVMRAAAPPEFQEHWQALQRELLLAARAVIDHYLERAEERDAAAVRVEDIPIE